MVETLTALSQRNEAFWIGLAIFVLGVITPENLLFGGIGLSRALITLGGGILLLRLFVGVYRILNTTVQSGIIGYRKGKRTDK